MTIFKMLTQYDCIGWHPQKEPLKKSLVKTHSLLLPPKLNTHRNAVVLHQHVLPHPYPAIQEWRMSLE